MGKKSRRNRQKAPPSSVGGRAAGGNNVTGDPLAGLEGWDRLQAVANALGTQVERVPDGWNHLSSDDAMLMQQWERSMDPTMVKDGRSASEEMKKLGITPAFVKGLPVGNWHRLVMRMQLADAPVRYKNDPPLEPRDYIEVLPGNSVKWDMVGERGTLVEYFVEDDKWGIEMEISGEAVLVREGNLKRIPRIVDDDGSCGG